MPSLEFPAGVTFSSAIQPQLNWEKLVTLPTLDAAMLKVAETYDFRAHPYLIWMQGASTSRQAFRESQVPFRFAVESFSQALAAVLARIDDLEARLPLFANLTEEHGGGNLQSSHKATFARYLEGLGATAAELETPCTTAVLAFNQSVLSYCLTQPGESGAAMLGAIEYLYVGISAAIARTLVDRCWMARDNQSHYSTHETLDTQHADDLLTLAAPSWEVSQSRPAIARSLVLGAHYFWSLYYGLLPSV